MKPSKFQVAIYDHIKNSKNHLLVSAKAGSGKTTTIKNIIEQLDISKKVLVLAFNKSISEEMREKLPIYITVKTCHSMGMKTIKSIQRNVKVNSNKSRDAVLNYGERNEWGTLEAGDFSEKVKRFVKMVDLMRLNLSHDLWGISDRYGVDMEAAEKDGIIEIVKAITNDTSTIDFVDMVYRPAVFNQYSFEKYDYVFVDECQDLSTAQQRFIQKLVKEDGKMIFVGDPSQAIYGFAGADAESFEKLRNIKNMDELPLNECYRCSKNIIKFINSIEPDIEAFKGNPDGEVNENAKVSEIIQGDMVLCRMTLPLVVLCYKLIGEGKKAYVKGRDVGKTLISLIEKSKTKSLIKLNDFLDGELQKTLYKLSKLNPQEEIDDLKEKRTYVMMKEKIQIIKTMIANNQRINSCDILVDEISKIFNNSSTGICLSTIHKSKGLESERVFIIDRDNMQSTYAKKDWELVQERNLEYVAYSRAKTYLGFISDWHSKEEDATGADMSDYEQSASDLLKTANLKTLF